MDLPKQNNGEKQEELRREKRGSKCRHDWETTRKNDNREKGNCGETGKIREQIGSRHGVDKKKYNGRGEEIERRII